LKTHRRRYEELQSKSERAKAPAGEQAVEKQHARGKRTARERVLALVDEDSFTELDRFVVHRSDSLGAEDKEFLATASSRDARPSRAGKSSSSRKISRFSAARWAKRTPRKFAKSWTWPFAPVRP